MRWILFYEVYTLVTEAEWPCSSEQEPSYKESVQDGHAGLKGSGTDECAHLYIPKPELRAVVWATSDQVAVIRTPRDVRDAVSMSF